LIQIAGINFVKFKTNLRKIDYFFLLSNAANSRNIKKNGRVFWSLYYSLAAQLKWITLP